MVTVANVVTTRTNATSRNARVTNSSVRRRNARTPKRPPEIPRMGIKVVKEVARGVAKTDPLTPRGAHERPSLHPLLLLHPLLPQVTPRSAPKGITLPLRGIIPRRGAWPGWPSPSLLQGWMSSSLMRSRGAARKRRTWFSGSSWKSGIRFFERCLTPVQHFP